MICPHCQRPFKLTARIPDHKRIRIQSLRNEGYTYREIATKVGVSFAVVGRILKEMEAT